MRVFTASAVLVQIFAFYSHVSVLSLQYTYPLDIDGGVGRSFDGIGAISGGGATSHLLVNYPEPQKSQILDFLFKPQFGASLHIFKVEIGGDAQSSEGTESSHMHEAWDENYFRGYEWWMMREAKQRNPDILLYGLPWGFPGWIGGDDLWPFKNPNITAQYIIKWIQGAKKFHNLTIDYIGLWNEKPCDVSYVKVLRNKLDESGLGHVKIVAADMIGSEAWDVVKDMAVDNKFNQSIDKVGGHYTNTASTEEAKHCGKPLWSSEDSTGGASEEGAACLAWRLNQNYVNGLMTSTILWNALAAYYDDLPYPHSGLMTSNQPWSGHYEVAAQIWTTAHTTQFTRPGWHYLKHGAGVGFLKYGGSYVSLVSPDFKDFTLIIETSDVKNLPCVINPPRQTVQHQQAIFVFKGKLKNRIQLLHVWHTKFSFGKNSSEYFRNEDSILVTNGSLTLDLIPNQIYTLTTINNGFKGDHGNPPPPGPFPVPYHDDFESYPIFGEANNFAQQVGAFEIHDTQVPSIGKVMRQVVQRAPVYWCPLLQTVPLSVIGNYSWSDVKVYVDVYFPLINSTRGVFLGAGIDQGGCYTYFARGIFLFLLADGTYIISTDLERTEVVYKGTFSLVKYAWYTLTLDVQGDKVIAYIDWNIVYSGTVKNKPTHGFIGLGTDDFKLVEFDNFAIEKAQ